ncbi:hypothetical protein [Dyella mobilis]|uniref:DUF2330 domain-containing protein n=1 Tax=Dyella mobilis TaxID=1849582 RepID=A0ABS2KCB1_9GAMM|nr:hypothetical protein [Dyella mobilis]MBM7128823.1 hypothetical protein [Dyella mobilis]GLQ99155.1 hypothetical protein GCM10007863_35750 [Dyella mobilis]
MNGWEVPKHSWHKGFSRSRAWFVAAAFCFAPLYAYGQAVEPTAERVVIDSEWGGLDPDAPFRTHIVIEKEGAHYRLTGGHSKSRHWNPLPEQAFSSQDIAPERVAELVGAMKAPVQPLIDLRTLEPTVNEAQQEIDDILKDTKQPSASTGSWAKVLAWRDSLRSPGALAQLLTTGFDQTHTDDFPSIDIQVTLSDGTKLSAQSRSQHYLMLPWENARGDRTYSPNIPRALDALLPKDATNKERLEGVLDDFDLKQLLERGLDNQVGQFDTESAAPDSGRLLDANAKAVGIALVSWKSRRWDARLQLPDSP